MKCKLCKLPFEKKVRNQKFCSLKCGSKFHNSRYKRQGWHKTTRTCKECKKNYTPTAHNQIYCSKKCSVARFDFSRIYNDIHNKKYKDLKKSWLKVRVVVFDRDDFTCQYCGRARSKGDNIILHIDHKIPKNKGGSDNLDNLVTSCSECNLGKVDIMLKYWQDGKNNN